MSIRSIITDSEVFKKKDYGILQEYYPKATIWSLRDSLGTLEEIQESALEFYSVYYMYRFKFDLITESTLAEILFNFSTLEGPKKLLQKLSVVLKEDIKNFDSKTIDLLNAQSKDFTKLLLLELYEFYNYVGRLDDGKYLLKLYRKI